MTTTEIQEPAVEEPRFEIVPADVKSASTELAAPSDKVLTLFKPFQGPFENAALLLAEEEKATTAAEARALRLKMVKARTTITATKDDSKEGIKLDGKIIDWFNNTGCTRLKESEERLLDIEKAEERAEAARIEALREERQESLETLGHVSHGLNLGTLTDEQWAEYHQQAKDAFFARREREKKAREEAEALAKKEAEERETQRLENVRLKAEAEAREAELKAEREERERVEAAAKIEREKLEQARIAAEDKARRGREVAESKAKAEREKLEAAAAEERRKAQEAADIAAKKQAAAEAEAKALRDAEAKRIADEKAAEAAKAKAEALAAKKAAAAPDKAKLMEFAAQVRKLEVPIMKSVDGKNVAVDVGVKVDSFAKWIETQAATL